MDEEFEANSVIKVLQKIFKDYSGRKRDYLSRVEIIKFFFDYKIIDTCGYNIFQINSFLKQLNPDEDKITLKMFLVLLFYIYKVEMQPNEEKSTITVNEVSPLEVNKITEDRLKINSTTNIIKAILKRKEEKKPLYTFETPNFSNEDIKYICSFEVLNFLSSYMKSIEAFVFDKYIVPLQNSEKIKPEYNFKHINIVQINKLIFDYPIFKNFDSETIANYMCLFIKDISKEQVESFKKIFDDRLDDEDIIKVFDGFLMDYNEINFSYSCIIILLSLFAIKLPSSEGKNFQEAISFLFEEEFGFLNDEANFNENINEQEEKEEELDYIPESETLKQAKLGEISDEDPKFLEEFLEVLDRELPEGDKNILSFKNDMPNHSNKLSSNPYKVIPAKYPVERLQVEVEEEAAAKLLEKETRQIAKAKKPKRTNARDAQPKEIHMDELPVQKNYELKYRGKNIVDSLTNRLINKTFKKILPNSNIYPSLIKEALIVPKSLPTKVREVIVESYKDQVRGHLEFAIRRLEKAQILYRDYQKKEDLQSELFFSLNFGFLYEDLDFNIIALKYYYKAYNITSKLLTVDPDIALVYSYLGAYFLKLNEIEWSMRSYQAAKEKREETIGGDTLDTAAIYNNLGVVAFYSESYLPAKNYFQLAFEITRSILGLADPRTLDIKNNLSKLRELNFNKNIQFKTLSLYPTPGQKIQNPKKKRK